MPFNKNYFLSSDFLYSVIKDGMVATIRKANQNYHPKVYPGKITLFQVMEVPKEYTDNKNYANYIQAWKQLAAGGLEIYEVPGNHNSVMSSERHVKILAEKLINCMQRCSKGGEQ